MWTADLSDLDAATTVARASIEQFGRVDALVNNAAIGKRKLVQTLTAVDLDTTMRTNFTSPVRMAMTLLPSMIERGSGLVVNVSSMGGRLGIAHEAAYSASKFAMCGWSESARIDLEGTGVKVKLVLPGPIATEIWELQPGELPGMYDGPFVTAADCAADIVTAMEDPDGFEYYVPEQVPGGWAQKDLVVGKSQNCDQFLTGMAQMAANP
jgi:short-subunit dehydrogenase